MLVLSRKRGEKIVIPQCAVSVTVVAVQGNSVRLGISAPPEVAVHREELWREIHAEEAAAVPVEVAPDALDAFAAELGDAVCQIAQRHGLADSDIDSESSLRRSLATAVKNWSERHTQPAQDADHTTHDSRSGRRPR